MLAPSRSHPRTTRSSARSDERVRSARLGLRATPRQELVLRRAAQATHKSLTDFILDSACQAAQDALLDQRLFMATKTQQQALARLFDRPEQDNPGLRDLLTRRPPWAKR